MKKYVITLFVFVFFALQLNAQEQQASKDTSYWSLDGSTGINFSQMSFTNWAGGGQNSYAFNGLLNIGVNYNKDRLSWENSLDLGYGVIQQEGEQLKKSDDKIDLSSKLGYMAREHWFYTGILSFKSQFDKGYNYAESPRVMISDFLAPAYLLYSVGMDYKPNDVLSVYASVVTGKTTIVRNQELADKGAFGVEEGENQRTELGGYVKINYSQEVIKNVKLKSKLDLFSNYLDRPEHIDVGWEVLVNMKINEFLSANINTNLLYDHDIKLGEEQVPKIQFKEVLGIGLSYSL